MTRWIAALTTEVVNTPLIKLKDLAKSYQTLMSRMDEASQIEARMMGSAKENVRQLEQMTAELEERARDASQGLSRFLHLEAVFNCSVLFGIREGEKS
ncbi:MAG: hypothetical protein B6245_21080 [Desulfobacteraceae bacterium 4572_88]|nr:MAG: hypothetical protein B6245_21080 [Desulfobacteraceae bacterium 4572_88]RLC15561.1 MAG: hypothetical protein DRI57_12670 [Deltaproteobacteria bacterium]